MQFPQSKILPGSQKLPRNSVAAESPPGFAATELQGQFLAAGENLALRKLRFSLRPSTALLPDIVFGYKVDI